MKQQNLYSQLRYSRKQREFVAHVDGVERRVSRAILSGVNGADKSQVYWLWCDFFVCHGGANDVKQYVF